ncbi:hypothetical protein [Rhizobium ruizarguesonis]|uniref:hypothetical protein n=1 Tax=Rhizobium ruizarguesonis TaxID=2081791 RepID=UPI00103D0784|nr:hypothetical protein [Rhizobium ruizarguesonis]MBY5892982.1 hypothetical protein [Rhizobium leguminosarum]NEH78153.1 hypothetical protein [Rhizobium ruizarguesonis]TBY54430.1 hypothetical protein E0H59_13095 [Rhizobium leguminosarum bv. viciae]
MRRENLDHGFSTVAWEKAKAEAMAVLRQRVKRGDPITYSDLVNKITAVNMEPHDTRLAHFLGEISTEEHKAARPLTTALVVHKHDLQPGKGFFDLSRSLGFSFNDEIEFWSDQIDRLRSQWK